MKVFSQGTPYVSAISPVSWSNKPAPLPRPPCAWPTVASMSKAALTTAVSLGRADLLMTKSQPGIPTAS